ncbi:MULTISPECIES: hypothetical protein [Leptolyngbya]|uniref:hypothetical protein n=1 Tax=Leptolyngbya TaxID=47251 RepID=UPI0018EFA88D|nr:MULTISPECIES: hypothetical protein [Leptolyngbya]ULP33553.1 hypothetical protein MCP04_32795 [Leptolyngbya boryana IU 594]
MQQKGLVVAARTGFLHPPEAHRTRILKRCIDCMPVQNRAALAGAVQLWVSDRV